MASLGDLVANLGVNVGGWTRGLSTASSDLGTFTASVTRRLSRLPDLGAPVRGIVAGMRSGLGAAMESLGKFGLAVNGARAGLEALKTLTIPVQIAAQAEQNAIAFTTMLGSAEKAKQTLEGLERFAASTPFQMPEIVDASKKLLAFGTSADDLQPTLRALGDVSAGIGAPIGEIAELYGKARVQGRLFAEDVNQFTGRGIPLIQQLAAQFGVADSEVKKLVESGQVNFGHLQTAIADLTKEGGQFGGLMEAQSQSLAGQWSTAQDNINLALKDIGVAMIEAFDLKGILGNTNDFLSTFRSEWLPSITGVFTSIRDTWKMSTDFLREMWGGWLTQAWDDLSYFARNYDILLAIAIWNVILWAKNSWAHVSTFFTNFGISMKWLWDVFKAGLTTMGNFLQVVVTNMITNLSQFFKAAVNFAKGKGWKAEMTPLLEGFQATFAKMPEFAKAAVQETLPELESLYEDLNRREKQYQNSLAERAQQAAAPVVEEPALTLSDIVQDAPASPPAQDTKQVDNTVHALELGTSAAVSKIFNALMGPGTKSQEQKIADNTKAMVAAQQQANTKLAVIAAEVHALPKTVPQLAPAIP